MVDIAAVIRHQEIGAGNGGRQVGVQLNQLVGAVAVLEGQGIFLGFGFFRFCLLRLRYLRFFRFGSFHRPGRAIKGECIILIQCVLTAVLETKDRTCGQIIGLSCREGVVKVKGQYDGAAHLLHTDPAHLLILITALVDIAAVIRHQEIGAGNGSRQIGIDLNQLIGTVAVLESQGIILGLGFLRLGFLRIFRLGCVQCPRSAVKTEGLILLQGKLTAIGEAEYSARRQEIGLPGGEMVVEMEGQHDGTADIFHADPSKILIEVCTLVNAAAIVACCKVRHRQSCRQIGIDLNQVACTIAVFQAECTLLGCFRLGNFRHGSPRTAIPPCIKGGFYQNCLFVVIDDGTFHHRNHLALMVQPFQTDGGGILVAHNCRLGNLSALKQNGALEADGCAVCRCAEIVDIRELHQRIQRVSRYQCYLAHQLTAGAVCQGHILGFGDGRNCRYGTPGAAVPLTVKGFLYHHGTVAVVDDCTLKDRQKLTLMGCFQSDDGVLGIAYEQGVLHQLAVQHHNAFEAQGGIVCRCAEIIDIQELDNTAGSIAGLQNHFVFHDLLGAVA